MEMNARQLEAARVGLSEAITTVSTIERAFRSAGYGMLEQRAGKVADELQELLDRIPDLDDEEPT